MQLLVFAGGTSGYYLLTDESSLLDCAFMTAITITTVGYGESIPVSHDPVLQVFTIFLLIIGMGAVLYFVSALAALMIEGQLRDIFQRWQMERRVAGFENHFIIAGLGRTGRNIAEEVLRGDNDCVLIDNDEQRLDEFVAAMKKSVNFVVGDATDDDILRRAGIERAPGRGFLPGQ
ncbi:MAG: NAD-binding protein [Bradymonadaceae bacterium]|nr:NAD-binding protein [Lujinxingiaceae bacterium]